MFCDGCPVYDDTEVRDCLDCKKIVKMNYWLFIFADMYTASGL